MAAGNHGPTLFNFGEFRLDAANFDSMRHSARKDQTMGALVKRLLRSVAAANLFAAALVLVPAAQADGISFEISDLSLTTTSGGTVTFDGTITNGSGVNLNGSDFFFNFFGYDFSSVNPIQDLGVVTDFVIPSGTTSSSVPLFDVTLGSVPLGSSFPVEVQLEDINNDLSAVQTVTVSVPGEMAIPEPATLLLLGTGLGAAFTARRKRNYNTRQRTI